MHKIKEITLKNFKFFYGENKISIDHKHLLIYGENGSGKSSIYWALFTFLQSVFKTDARQVQKYFLPAVRNPESIKNRYSLDADDSYIEIYFDDENNDPRIKRISNTTVNTRTDKFVEEITLSSDLIDYKSIFNIYNFTNRDRVKFFGYLEKNLMPFINLRTQLVDLDGNRISKNLNDWWNYLKKGLDPYPGIYDQKYHDFQSLINKFNEDLKFYLDSITETANDYLKDHFKEKISISFTENYVNCTYNEFNTHNKGRNKTTIAPEIYLTATLLDANLNPITNKLERVHTYLNEAKLSSIALAIRMAILKDKFVVNSPKILVLDDLLLSLDMGNREAVLNIVLEEYCGDYQIFLLTHDRVFFETVLSFIKTFHANKLKNTGELNKEKLDKAFEKEWKILEMYESSMHDGKLIPVFTEHKSNLQKALYYFNDIDGIDYNACGNNLRAALEGFFKGFIPHNFLKDNDGQPIANSALTLNPLITKCIDYFNHLDWDISLLDRLNRYRERALNQASHYNPKSNYFKRELQDTFEIINLLKQYKSDAIINTDEIIKFDVKSQGGKTFTYTFKVLDEIRLYKEINTNSFYCNDDKRTYAVIGITEDDNSKLLNPNPITGNRTLQELYEETIVGLEKKINENCIKEDDIFEVVKNVDGISLNELKRY
jgi:energy-coupling factor transporter ATP-binding protein EcfA2